jgi:hypothetical protein
MDSILIKCLKKASQINLFTESKKEWKQLYWIWLVYKQIIFKENYFILVTTMFINKEKNNPKMMVTFNRIYSI